MIEVQVEAPAWVTALPQAAELACIAGEAALAISGGVAVLLTDDAAVRELNERFRAKDKATNVLSFPAPPNPENHLGDVALAYGVCAAEAAEQGKTLAAINVVGTAEELADATVQRKWLPLLLDAARALRPVL